MTTDQRIEKALVLRKLGYNCAQTVMMVFSDTTGVDENSSATLCAPLGAGVSAGEICGVANAMALVAGAMINDPSPNGKMKAMPQAKKLLNKFSSQHNGCITCRDLKGKCGKSCDELIIEGIKIVSDSLNDTNARYI